jgi:lysozyme
MKALPKDKQVFRGAYHFLTSSDSESGEAQAKSFLRLIRESGGADTNDMPPVLDLEWDVAKGSRDRWSGKTADEIIDKALSWLSYVERNGDFKKKPIIYTARSWWRERIGDEKKFAKLSSHYDIWIADYSDKASANEVPAVPMNANYSLWQFSDHTKLIQGYAGKLDGNIYKGSYEKFLKDFNLQ